MNAAAAAQGLNILHVVPALSRSHVMFSYKLAQTFVGLGHNVTLLSLFPISAFGQKEAEQIKLPQEIKEYRVFGTTDKNYTEHCISLLKDFTFKSPNLRSVIRVQSCFQYFWETIFQQTIYNASILEPLSQVKFDLGLTHYFDACPIAVFEIVGIEKKLFYAAGTYILEHAGYTLGLPSTPSFIPQSSSKFTDFMTFRDRISNFLTVLSMLVIYHLPGTMIQNENLLFKESPHEDRPSLPSIYENMVTILVNGEQAMEFPRPFHKDVLFLGDLSGKKFISKKESVLENDEWKKIIEINNKGIILFSLGTMASAADMPQYMKDAIINAFAHYPEYTILWKYEGSPPLTLNQSHSHIHLRGWLPQADILNHPNTKLFITHGGYNSLLEATHSATPMIFIPLFVDQYANAMRAQRHNLGLTVDKVDVTEESLVHAISDILSNPKYKESCVKFSAMLQDKPGDPLDGISLYLKHAHVNGWHNKRSLYGKQLTFVQYFCLDVILLWSILFFIVIGSWLYFINLTLIFMRWK